ncbi:putative aspartic peptidase domain superfamily [Helianthus annuus]|uniref:Aspartic peptidase domain superfamily n=1 Tax=Helianthus annuus TaxID=4232 RepID=A0A9K3NJ42_HELAN|nr:putative aspartic peptidase domain superfamily [Helianthus annuus]
MSSAPALAKPEKGDVLSLYLAVSSTAVSAVLVKDHEGTQYPIYYVSKSLLDAESRYSHLEKLILALIMASTKLRHYFETHTIIVRTNFPIKNVLRKPDMSGRMAKWAVKLSAHDIRYEPRTAIKSQALADFVADFSSDLQKEAELEVQQLDETKDPWILHTDGSSNIKGTGLGILLKSPQGDIIPHSIACEFQATNNEAVEAFKMGLLKDSLFYDDLVMTPCRNLDEVRTRALRFIRLEDDKRIQERQVGSSKQEKQGSSFKNNKFKSYHRNDNQNVHVVDQEEDDEDYPPISEYCFSVDNHELILAMQNLGEKARWPRKNDKPSGTKDKSKWCAYHEDFGHLTEECIALRKEIGYLLSKGHLKELLGRKKQRTQDPERIPEKAPAPPANAQVINFISGGSDICGTSFSAAKRHAKEAKMDNGERPIRTSSVSEGKTITFDENDRINIQDPHHDSLVITLFISNHFVRRILIDGGSSVNIIQLDVLKKMGVPESDITPRSSVLVGFSGETKKTLGDIKLPIYVEGLHNYQKFCVIDCLSCCNVILGRPWIHDMKAVPSTYHQCVKLPSPWGIIKIDSDQKEAKDCYTSSMKPTSKPREQ